ncbi:hypothetical protein MBLNU457_5432t1 [Dothideomycetes sp. NU457]
MAWHNYFLLAALVALVLLPSGTDAFGAGNIASISKVEGQNWRHGDIEDMLKTVAFLPHHKWTSMMVKRAYFGNWLRDYSQAVDVGALTKVPANTIRILVWILGFMSFGYATGEFEVTEERLGCYRPEEHIDNPKDYADNQDARKFDKRLRGPVSPEELAIDPRTGMKNYIANEDGGWATSTGYVKYSFKRSIHYGRLYTHGSNKGREEDLCEALRCLGQGLHCLEDFGAHSQYVELALRELGYHGVFPHVGSSTQINLRGKQVFPLVTGTFGGVDFLHSVLGEASDHVTQSEVDEATKALDDASNQSGSSADNLIGLLSKVPGTGNLGQQARDLEADSNAQARANSNFDRGIQDDYSSSRGVESDYSDSRGFNPAQLIGSFLGGGGGQSGQSSRPGQSAGQSGQSIQQLATSDPEQIVKKIYPILLFRDNVVRTINGIVSKIPGLESIVEKITETVTLFVMRLLAPYVMPLISLASQGLKQGSGAVVQSSANQQYLVFDDPHCTDPTHSMLSKDHFSNILNEPAGKVASCILQYAAPRVIYAWNHPEISDDQVVDDVVRAFHHPAIRDRSLEVHRNMFEVVEQWARSYRGADLNQILGTQSVRAGKNHKAEAMPAQGFQAYNQAFHQGTSAMSSAVFGNRDMNEPAADGYSSYIRKREGEVGHTARQEPEPSGFSGPARYGGQDEPQSSAYPVQSHYGGGNYGSDEYRPHGDPSHGAGYGQGPPSGSFTQDPYANPAPYQQSYQSGYGGPAGPQGSEPWGQQPPMQSYGQQPPPGQGYPGQGYHSQGGYPGQEYNQQNQYGQGGYSYGQGPRY